MSTTRLDDFRRAGSEKLPPQVRWLKMVMASNLSPQAKVAAYWLAEHSFGRQVVWPSTTWLGRLVQGERKLFDDSYRKAGQRAVGKLAEAGFTKVKVSKGGRALRDEFDYYGQPVNTATTNRIYLLFPNRNKFVRVHDADTAVVNGKGDEFIPRSGDKSVPAGVTNLSHEEPIYE